jgi:hypothetical protein
MELDRAIEYALEGKALLFVGSGFSRGAVNLRNGPFKTAPQFAGHLAKLVNLPAGTPLDDVSEEFASKFGADRLIEELEKEFSAKEISSVHRGYTKIPWMRIYTTNYDDVLESAYKKVAERIKPVTLSDDLRQIPRDCLLSVHLNGYVGRVTRASIWSEVKLTDTSYLAASLIDSPWSVLFREDLQLARSVFFVGYSISDLDIRRVIFEEKSLKDKAFFVIGKLPSPGTLSRARRFGAPLEYDSDKFLEQVTRKASNYALPERASPTAYCLEKFKPVPTSLPLLDRFVFDVLLFGHTRPEYVWKSLHGGQRYVLDRKEAQEAVDRVDSGARAVVLPSDLGNGKTLILEEVKCKAFEKGYDVFSLVKSGTTLNEEIEWALLESKKSLFLIDNYPDWMNAIRFYAGRATKSSSLILTARTSAHDVLVDRLSELLHVGDMLEISVDELREEELVWLIGFMDEYGLWGEMAAWAQKQKLDYLSRVCRAQWQSILIKIFESPQILSRFESLFDDLRKKQNYYQVLLTILAFSVIGHVPSLSTLVDFCGRHILEPGLKRDPAIREVIDFDKGEVRLRSSVAAEFILKHIADPNTTVEVVVGLARTADKLSAASSQFFELFKNITRFSSLQGLFPEKDRAKTIYRYYEAIKSLNNARVNPQFWLQYAIACLVFEDYARAEKYFEAAYSYAEQRESYDSYQIDNHYARFLLMRAINNGDVSKCMPAFRNARKIIFGQMENERLHYPYRVAATLGEFYDAFAPSLDMQQRAEIKRAAKFISDRIEKLPRERQNQRSVISCWHSMQRIIGAPE